MELVSGVCLGVGLILWWWGTPVLLTRRSVVFKLHYLSVADILGSLALMVGLLCRRPREWPLLLLAILSLVMWNTVLGYVLAYCAHQATAGTSGSSPHDP